MSWSLIKHLGEGSYGSVYLATSSPSPDDDIGSALNLPPLFAVKSAPHSNSDSLEYEREVFHELRDCPNIIRCYGADACFDEDGVILYNIFLEYAAGGSLVDRIYSDEQQPMDEEEIKDYTRSILRGLRHMHGLGMIHCDIKPDNVLLVEDDCTGGYLAKIGDLGLALQRELTGSVKLRGTLPYLALESRYGQYGSGVDIWALGCTVAEMFLRKQLKTVRSGVTWEMVKLMAKQGVLIPHGISEDARDFLSKCLTVDPVSRWSADRLLKEHPFIHAPECMDLGCLREPSDLSDECRLSSDIDSDDESLMPMKVLKRYREEMADGDDVKPAVCKKPKLASKSAAPFFLRGV